MAVIVVSLLEELRLITYTLKNYRIPSILTILNCRIFKGMMTDITKYEVITVNIHTTIMFQVRLLHPSSITILENVGYVMLKMIV